ncbi:hypothetical protein KC19_11G075000, partial [Ceratodon purpureus]
MPASTQQFLDPRFSKTRQYRSCTVDDYIICSFGRLFKKTTSCSSGLTLRARFLESEHMSEPRARFLESDRTYVRTKSIKLLTLRTENGHNIPHRKNQSTQVLLGGASFISATAR